MLARARAQLRRHLAGATPADSVVSFGSIVVDCARRVVKCGREALHMTPIEYRLLKLPLAEPGRVLAHSHLLKAVCGPGHAQDVHQARVHTGNLRKKIEDDASHPQWVLTEAGSATGSGPECQPRPP